MNSPQENRDHVNMKLHGSRWETGKNARRSGSGIERKLPTKAECVRPAILTPRSLTIKISSVVIEEPSRNHSDLNEFILYDIHLGAIDHSIDGNISL